MGPSAVLDPSHHRSLHPVTPPELVSAGASTFSSTSSPATEAAWNTSRPLASPPMSDYERGPTAIMPGEKSAGDGPGFPSATHGQPAASRQQLPSLSSLFGPPSSRPLHSPMSDRGPLTAASPLDRPRLLSGGRSHGESYFPPTLSPPVSQPRTSYDFKFESDRPSFLGGRHSTPGPVSPGFRAHNHGRADVDSSQRWPSQQDSRNEYTLEPHSPGYRQPRDHFRLQFSGHKDVHQGYPDHRPSSTAQNPPPTPASMTTPDGSSRKDGLGPKIWTGTHFLPRFVRAAEVPGEGLCYFYDDGSHCKTVIDGEAVNAHWGVTKAGKPRKRLAIACVTCREKKIKCDPDYPRCVQCEKFGRVCKFKNAPRGGHNESPTSPPAEYGDARKTSTSTRLNGSQRSESDASSPRSPREQMRQPSPHDGGPNKRIRLDRDTFLARGDPPPVISRPMDHSKSQTTAPIPPPEAPRISEGVLSRAWQTNPYATDPQSINAVVAQFFVHIDSTMILPLLPEQATKAWVTDSVHRKSPEDLMLLYSILAVGVALSGGPKHIAFEYAQVAHYAQKTTTANCLQVAQSRVLLAVYYISVSRLKDATEIMSAATAAINHLQLNLELDKTRDADMTSFPLGLTRDGYSEARRRTLWSFFMLERLNGTFPERIVAINPEDVYVRLPADRHAFEEQTKNLSPFFDPLQLSISKSPDQPQEVEAYLVQMVHLWAESQSSLYRLVNRPIPAEMEATKISALVGALESWQAVLPSRLLFGQATLDSAAMSGQAGSFLAMHLLYSHAMIKLNRHSRAPLQLPADAMETNVRRCQEYAVGIVDVARSLESVLRARAIALSVPFPMMAAAVAEAVDVLSASRPISALDEVIDQVLIMKPFVDGMCGVWDSSRVVQLAIDKRLQLLNSIRHYPSYSPRATEEFRIVSHSEGGRDAASSRWEMLDPVQKLYARDMDMFYLGASE